MNEIKKERKKYKKNKKLIFVNQFQKLSLGLLDILLFINNVHILSTFLIVVFLLLTNTLTYSNSTHLYISCILI